MMETAKLKVMGNITVNEDGQKYEYKCAILIQFDSPESIRAAIRDMECKFTWSDCSNNTKSR